MPSPFYCCSRISNPADFVGREAELARIFTALDTANTGQLQSVSVVGPRRIGRSSLLYHLQHVYRQRLQEQERYLFLYLDLLSGRYTTRPDLLRGILNGLVDRLPGNAVELANHWREAARDHDISLGDFETAIRQARVSSDQSPYYPIICLDEFEQLSKHPEAFPQQLFDSWRSLINSGYIAFVIASSKPLYELAEEEKLTSQFFNIFSDYIALGELTEAEAYRLVERGRKCDRPFVDDDIQRALEWAGRHPLKLQQAGRAIYDAKNQPNPDWRKVKNTYEAIVRQAFGRRTTWQQSPRWIRQLLEALGSLVLFWKADAHSDPAARRAAGSALLIILFILLLLLLLWPGFGSMVVTRVLGPMPVPSPSPTALPIP